MLWVMSLNDFKSFWFCRVVTVYNSIVENKLKRGKIFEKITKRPTNIEKSYTITNNTFFIKMLFHEQLDTGKY